LQTPAEVIVALGDRVQRLEDVLEHVQRAFRATIAALEGHQRMLTALRPEEPPPPLQFGGSQLLN
jgi:hypothetical protein